MAFVLADTGADAALNAWLNNSWPASKDFVIKLYTNNYVPLDTSATGDFTEATGGGYVTKALSNGSWTVNVANDPSDGVYAKQTWTFTGALTAGATIYGYFVVNNNGSGTLVGAEKLTTAFTPATNGDTLDITPQIQMSKGTPT